MKRWIIGVVAAAAVYGCTAASPYRFTVTPEGLFGITDTLWGEFLPKKLGSNGNARVFYTRYGLLCEGQHVWKRDKRFLQLIDTVTGRKLCSGGVQGRGPGEMLDWSGCYFDQHSNIYYTYDMMSRRIGRFRIGPSEMETLPFIQLQKTSVYRLAALSDTALCILNFFPNQSISIIDDNGTRLDGVPDRPIEDKRINYNYPNFYLNTNLNLTADRKLLVASDPDCNTIQVYSTEGNRLKLLRDTMYLKADYEIRDGGRLSMRGKHIMAGGISYVTDRYIYIVTKMEKCEDVWNRRLRYKEPPALLIFDLSCRFLGGYVLEYPLYGRFTVSPDNRTLYAYVIDKRENSRIVKYALPAMENDDEDKR